MLDQIETARCSETGLAFAAMIASEPELCESFALCEAPSASGGSRYTAFFQAMCVGCAPGNFGT